MQISENHRTSAWFKAHGPSALIFLLFIAGISVFYREIQHLSLHTLWSQLKALSAGKIILACIFTLAGYTALIGYDWSALRYIGKKLPPAFIAFTSFIGYSLSNTIGISWLSGGAVRYRLYSRVGLTASEIAQIIAFCVIGFGIGEVLVGGVVLSVHPDIFSSYFSIPSSIVRIVAISSILVFVVFLVLRSRSKGQLKWKKATFDIPSANILLGQVLFSVLDISLAGAVLYTLLPDGGLSFLTFLAVYAVALLISVLSHVPGGVGVFEAIMVTALKAYVPIDALTIALLAYRAIYYLLPFLLGLVLLIVGEAYIGAKKRWSGVAQLEGTIGAVAKVANGAVPAAVSGVTFLSGVLLLIGSSVSMSPTTLKLLGEVFPIELIELSHVLGGIVGMVLILLSHALWHRVRAALWLTGILFIVGAVISFMQTLDYDRAFVLILALLLLVLGREHFYRHARLFSSVFNLRWFLVTAAALASFLWLLFFSFKATPYQQDLWWQFALNDQVSRGLRTIVAAVSTYLILFMMYALRPPRKDFELPDAEQISRATELLKTRDNPDANFVLTGDKYLMWAEDQSALVMFGTQGGSWVSLGSPIGPKEQAYELMWQFKQEAEDNRRRPVFYQIGGEHLDWYINANFNLYKLGEEAWVNLQMFSLEGSSRSKLRQSRNRAERDGLSFRLLHPPYEPQLFEQLKLISDQWLAVKNVREKGFSLGKFDPHYLNNFPLALVYENGEISAFANVLSTNSKHKASIDLMRHHDSASAATMEYLFVELMLALKQEGYLAFSLGMAPLSGLENRQGASKWDKFGNVIYKSGEDFYNFNGLRQFKNKFKPEWKPKYLATVKGASPYLTMVEIAAIISGDLLGMIRK